LYAQASERNVLSTGGAREKLLARRRFVRLDIEASIVVEKPSSSTGAAALDRPS
jgi:hypothetical protein